MHYEAEVSPLSRARRISPAAINRLASYSEDWHRRTLSGIQPKRILALFSEDDWTIYENRVFARLLDKLDNYLKKREEEVCRLEETYQEALNLGESEHLDYRLRHALCRLWGDALSVDETSHMVILAGKTIEVVRRLGKKVKVLRQSDLYRLSHATPMFRSNFATPISCNTTLITVIFATCGYCTRRKLQRFRQAPRIDMIAIE